VLEDEAGVFRFQLRQTGVSSLFLDLDPQAADADAEQQCRQTLERFLHTQGLLNVELDIERGGLQRHPVSGKVRRVLAMTDATQPMRRSSQPNKSRRRRSPAAPKPG
jgi:hypothetical protein